MKITNENILIGYQGEAYSREITYVIDESLKTEGVVVYLEFEKPNGDKVVSSKLDLAETSYILPDSLLDDIGYLKAQLVAYYNDKCISKSPIYSFYITESINAQAVIIEDVVAEIVRELENTKADDLSYDSNTSILQLMAAGNKIGSEVIISGGTTDYNELENQPMTVITNLDKNNLVNLRELESGLYRLYGYFKPYEASTKRFTVPAPLFVALVKDDDVTYMQMYFALNNLIQYYVLTDENYTRTDIKLNEMVEKLADLETTDGELNTEVDNLTTEVDNLSERVSNLENNSSELESIKTELSDVISQQQELKSLINTNNNNISALQTELSELGELLDELNGEVIE